MLPARSARLLLTLTLNQGPLGTTFKIPTCQVSCCLSESPQSDSVFTINEGSAALETDLQRQLNERLRSHAEAGSRHKTPWARNPCTTINAACRCYSSMESNSPQHAIRSHTNWLDQVPDVHESACMPGPAEQLPAVRKSARYGTLSSIATWLAAGAPNAAVSMHRFTCNLRHERSNRTPIAQISEVADAVGKLRAARSHFIRKDGSRTWHAYQDLMLQLAFTAMDIYKHESGKSQHLYSMPAAHWSRTRSRVPHQLSAEDGVPGHHGSSASRQVLAVLTAAQAMGKAKYRHHVRGALLMAARLQDAIPAVAEHATLEQLAELMGLYVRATWYWNTFSRSAVSAGSSSRSSSRSSSSSASMGEFSQDSPCNEIEDSTALASSVRDDGTGGLQQQDVVQQHAMRPRLRVVACRGRIREDAIASLCKQAKHMMSLQPWSKAGIQDAAGRAAGHDSRWVYHLAWMHAHAGWPQHTQPLISAISMHAHQLVQLMDDEVLTSMATPLAACPSPDPNLLGAVAEEVQRRSGSLTPRAMCSFACHFADIVTAHPLKPAVGEAAGRACMTLVGATWDEQQRVYGKDNGVTSALAAGHGISEPAAAENPESSKSFLETPITGGAYPGSFDQPPVALKSHENFIGQLPAAEAYKHVLGQPSWLRSAASFLGEAASWFGGQPAGSHGTADQHADAARHDVQGPTPVRWLPVTEVHQLLPLAKHLLVAAAQQAGQHLAGPAVEPPDGLQAAAPPMQGVPNATQRAAFSRELRQGAPSTAATPGDWHSHGPPPADLASSSHAALGSSHVTALASHEVVGLLRRLRQLQVWDAAAAAAVIAALRANQPFMSPQEMVYAAVAMSTLTPPQQADTGCAAAPAQSGHHVGAVEGVSVAAGQDDAGTACTATPEAAASELRAEAQRVVADLCAGAVSDQRMLRPLQLHQLLIALSDTGQQIGSCSTVALFAAQAVPQLTAWFRRGAAPHRFLSLPTDRLDHRTGSRKRRRPSTMTAAVMHGQLPHLRQAASTLEACGKLQLKDADLLRAIEACFATMGRALPPDVQLTALSGLSLLQYRPPALLELLACQVAALYPSTPAQAPAGGDAMLGGSGPQPACSTTTTTQTPAAQLSGSRTTSKGLPHLASAAILLHSLGYQGKRPYAKARDLLASNLLAGLQSLGPATTVELLAVLQARAMGLASSPLLAIMGCLKSHNQRWTQQVEQHAVEEKLEEGIKAVAWQLPMLCDILQAAAQKPGLGWDAAAGDAVVSWVVSSLACWSQGNAHRLRELVDLLVQQAAAAEHGELKEPGSKQQQQEQQQHTSVSSQHDLVREQVYAAIRVGLQHHMATAPLLQVAWSGVIFAASAPEREQQAMARLVHAVLLQRSHELYVAEVDEVAAVVSQARALPGPARAPALMTAVVNAVAWRLETASPAAMLQLAELMVGLSHNDYVFADELTRRLCVSLQLLDHQQLVQLCMLVCGPGGLKSNSRASLAKAMAKHMCAAMDNITASQVTSVIQCYTAWRHFAHPVVEAVVEQVKTRPSQFQIPELLHIAHALQGLMTWRLHRLFKPDYMGVVAGVLLARVDDMSLAEFQSAASIMMGCNRAEDMRVFQARFVRAVLDRQQLSQGMDKGGGRPGGRPGRGRPA